MKSNIFRKNLFVILILSLVMCGCSSTTEESSINLDADNIIEDAEILTLSDEINVKTIYTTEFQDDIYDQIQELKSNDYTFASPLIIANPYCTNTTSLYVYFNTDKSVEISYTITADGYSDFSYTTSGGYGTEHEYQLIGLVGGTINIVTLTATDEDGNIETTQWTYEAPEIYNQDEYIQLDITDGTSTQEVCDGLYTVLGND